VIGPPLLYAFGPVAMGASLICRLVGDRRLKRLCSVSHEVVAPARMGLPLARAMLDFPVLQLGRLLVAGTAQIAFGLRGTRRLFASWFGVRCHLFAPLA
jgi:hypothetical protein